MFSLSVCNSCYSFGSYAHFSFAVCKSTHHACCVFWVHMCYIIWLSIYLHGPILIICSIPWCVSWSRQQLLLVSRSFLLPVLIAKFLHSIDWFGRLLLMLLASILRIFGVVLSLCLCTGSKKLSFPNSTLKCSSFLTSIPTPFLPFPV